jgi:pimeloyl-ACP methyl ester carboxylesterase
LLTVAACTAPSSEFARRAAALNMTAERVRGDPFDHMVFSGAPQPGSHRLHVYLDGDGTPWLGGHTARDPTPRKPLVLSLMAHDAVASIYLGRPCYHGLVDTPGCSTVLWTSGRYSEAAVASMAAVVRRITADAEFDEIAWFGYSGGGSLAVLLAPRFPESTAVVTVSANLDIDAWTDAHGDLPLTSSLNPARQGPLPDRILQIHYAGGRDRVVPVDVVRKGVTGAGRVVVMPKYDHVCCWEQEWPRILAEVERATRAVAR